MLVHERWPLLGCDKLDVTGPYLPLSAPPGLDPELPLFFLGASRSLRLRITADWDPRGKAFKPFTLNGKTVLAIPASFAGEHIAAGRRMPTSPFSKIYPADANLIVSLLDIHVAPPAPGERPKEPLEILEAGTGHGSLTLHLARAINAANSCPPMRPPCSQRQILELPETKKKPVEEKKVVEKEDREAQAEIEGLQREWDGWRAQRNAIVHTVEISPHYSQHAENIVRGFRRGIYVGNVDFYVSSVEKWIKEQVTRRSTNERSPDPFLSHVILDMPSAHLRIPHVAPIMRDDAVLAVFMPSITQLGDCVDLISKQKLPLLQEKVVELGTGISSGRLWELRIATKRSSNDTLSQEAIVEEMSDETSEGVTDTEAEDSTSLSKREKTNGDEVLVCRPQVGARIAGGGFVGIWRKKKA
ncbi:tRNA (adenine-N(1)-)-methyltransferase [Histoplasma capsulatum H143]|uniref:tRNA (adenine(58)-N(1))-methyltransferase catalytic subunit TRM61 n=1 Tax=Ajellomyces capsulatus (strain H143) TaxID=544712 RepID=C6H2P7_AJECH|nr:tRNA (adenine-N(1)-)-methyltransferase [Histoplasma capsulatum H143]